eukprot:6200542-Pleurochrysis_carterae.AAC.5
MLIEAALHVDATYLSSLRYQNAAYDSHRAAEIRLNCIKNQLLRTGFVKGAKGCSSQFQDIRSGDFRAIRREIIGWHKVGRAA